MKTKRKAYEIVEGIFDLSYLAFIIVSGVILIASEQSLKFLFGGMAIILGVGDSFHLIPRVLAIVKNDKKRFHKSISIGELIASITMTMFYVLLYHFWQAYYGINVKFLTAIIYLLAVIRIIICLLPQNKWSEGSKYNLIRNIPFLILGVVVTICFTITSYNDSLKIIPIIIVLSYIFYIPVALFSYKNPKLGVLMLPKAVMYCLIICVGLFL